MFTTEIGVLVRLIAPLKAESWSDVSQQKKDTIMDRLREKFIFNENQPGVIESIYDTMATCYYSKRNRLHEKFLEYPTLAVALANSPPKDVTSYDWIYLCNLFCTEKFKATSQKNKGNRKNLTTTHTAGTKAFSKIRYDQRNP